MNKQQITTIRVSKQTIKQLEELKVHPRETLEQVIIRLITNYIISLKTKEE